MKKTTKGKMIGRALTGIAIGALAVGTHLRAETCIQCGINQAKDYNDCDLRHPNDELALAACRAVADATWETCQATCTC